MLSSSTKGITEEKPLTKGSREYPKKEREVGKKLKHLGRSLKTGGMTYAVGFPVGGWPPFLFGHFSLAAFVSAFLPSEKNTKAAMKIHRKENPVRTEYSYLSFFSAMIT